MSNLKFKEMLLLLVVGVPLLILLLAIFTNLTAFHSILGEMHQAIDTIALGVWDGVIMLFFTGLGLGVTYGVIRLRQMARVQIVGPGRHGHAQQALIVNEGKGVSRIEQLAAPNMDPVQQFEMLLKAQKIMQASNATALTEQRLLALLAKQQQAVVPQIEAPEVQIVESIAEVVRYEEIADEIPPEMSLLGVHPENGNLELTAWEKLKCLWIVGSSSTGKSNTVFGKAQEAKRQGAKFLVIDQHIVKEDSLGRKMMAYKDAFLRPIAVTDDEVLAALAWFKAEFERRVSCPVCARGQQCEQCSQKIVLVADEMNRMNRNERLRKALKEIVAICGEESRGFGMYGWFLSQKGVGLAWLRDSAITVIAHRLTTIKEALLVCNEDRAMAKQLLGFKVGRTYVWGVDFDEPMELQQVLYPTPKNESPATWPDGEVPTSTDELPTTSPHTDDLNYFTQDGKQDEVGEEEKIFYAQNAERIRHVAQMMMDGKSMNQIMAAEWGIDAPGGKYQAALPELREIQKFIAHRAFGSAYEADMN
jgi:hypothetical protein